MHVASETWPKSGSMSISSPDFKMRSKFPQLSLIFQNHWSVRLLPNFPLFFDYFSS